MNESNRDHEMIDRIADQIRDQRLDDTAVYEIAQDPTVQDTYWAATARGVY